jgi:hypothetical protein
VTTHELADALERLAHILKRGPQIELDQWSREIGRQPQARSNAHIAVNLATLAALSRIDKRQWAALIRENGFPVEVRPRDASRDILGKLLRFLEEHPDAIEHLRARAQSRPAEASPELMKALSILLREPDK